MTAQRLVWLVSEHSSRHGSDYLRGVYATADDARRKVRAIREAEDSRDRAILETRSVVVETMPAKRVEHRLTCTECGAVSTWLATARAEHDWIGVHLQGGPDHGTMTLESRTVKL